MAHKEINLKLTGRERYRTGWRSRVILQVEEQYEIHSYSYCHGMGIEEPTPANGKIEKRWRDAIPEDLLPKPQSLEEFTEEILNDN